MKAKVQTLPLWPDVGAALGLSCNGTYAAAQRGEIAGAMKFGRIWRVSEVAFTRMMTEGRPSRRPT
jgi:hypothetical protein